MDDWTKVVAGALLGALAGTFLGYLASYRLWVVQRRTEREQARRQLMRALNHELGRVFDKNLPAYDPAKVPYLDPIEIPSVDPLLGLAGDLGAGFVRVLLDLKVSIAKYNDLVRMANPILATPGLKPGPTEAQMYAKALEYRKSVSTARDNVRPFLNIPT